MRRQGGALVAAKRRQRNLRRKTPPVHETERLAHHVVRHLSLVDGIAVAAVHVESLDEHARGLSGDDAAVAVEARGGGGANSRRPRLARGDENDDSRGGALPQRLRGPRGDDALAVEQGAVEVEDEAIRLARARPAGAGAVRVRGPRDGRDGRIARTRVRGPGFDSPRVRTLALPVGTPAGTEVVRPRAAQARSHQPGPLVVVVVHTLEQTQELVLDARHLRRRRVALLVVEPAQVQQPVHQKNPALVEQPVTDLGSLSSRGVDGDDAVAEHDHVAEGIRGKREDIRGGVLSPPLLVQGPYVLVVAQRHGELAVGHGRRRAHARTVAVRPGGTAQGAAWKGGTARRVEERANQGLGVCPERVGEVLRARVGHAGLHRAAVLDDEHVHLDGGDAVAARAHEEGHVRRIPLVLVLVVIFVFVHGRRAVVLGGWLVLSRVDAVGGRRTKSRERMRRAAHRREGRDATAVVLDARGVARCPQRDATAHAVVEPGSDRDGGRRDGRTRADGRRRRCPSAREHSPARHSRRQSDDRHRRAAKG
mmetsp:Transcript_1248/g.4669  ORF Transcript_1248/g.4669 Transcript_1248/m.4669 type:complete len:537 (+) Transcript_1248:606-2216(+)